MRRLAVLDLLKTGYEHDIFDAFDRLRKSASKMEEVLKEFVMGYQC